MDKFANYQKLQSIKSRKVSNRRRLAGNLGVSAAQIRDNWIGWTGSTGTE